MKKGDLLFVYGSLRKGESADLSRNGLQVDYLGLDRINGTLYPASWYPGVKAEGRKEFDVSSDFVVGDVFRLRDDKIIQQLDAYEGYPSLFGRLETYSEGGKKVWVYIYNHDVKGAPVPGGDWCKRLSGEELAMTVTGRETGA